ncbi:MAG: hypothetical protein P1U77_01000 [Rubripirellula sp.]|nr:hypothetical protein [Rubripirellula sp.]
MSNTEQPKKGEFPFQEVGPGNTNGFLAWVRDHSSYLTAGGIADQFASMGSYAWGTLKNFLCLSPVFLLASLTYGWFHFANLERPYCLILTVATAVTVFAIFIDREKCRPSWWIFGKSGRACLARCGGWLLLGLLVGLLSMTVPLSVELIREHVHGLNWTWTNAFAFFTGSFGAIVAAQRAVPLSSGVKKQLAAIVFGLLGVGFLFSTLVLLTYFFVYGNVLGPLPAMTYWFSRTPESTILLIALAVLGIFVAIKVVRAWQGLGSSSLAVSLFFCVLPFVLFYVISSDNGFGPRIHGVTTSIGKLSRPLALVVDKPFDDSQLTPRHAKRISHLKNQLQGLNDYFETQPPEQSGVDERNSYDPKKSDGEKNAGDATQQNGSGDEENFADAHPYELTEFTKAYFSMAHHFVVDGYSFIDMDPLEKAKFRQAMAQMDRIGLVRLAQFRSDAGAPKNPDELSKATQEDCLAAVIRATVQNQALILKGDNAASLEEAVSDTRAKTALEGLQQVHVTALNQTEFATLTGTVVPKLGIAERKTSTAKGSLTLVPESAEFQEFAKPIKEGLLARYLSNESNDLPQEDAIPVVNGLAEDSVADAVGFERVRRLRITGDVSAMLDDVAAELRKESMGESPTADPAPKEDGYLRRLLVQVAINGKKSERERALGILADLSVPEVDPNATEAVQKQQYSTRVASAFDDSELINIAMMKFIPGDADTPALLPADQLVMNIAAGKEGDLYEFENIRHDLAAQSASLKAGLYLFLAGVLGVFAFFTDVNSTSINGFYRDHLAQAFLLRDDEGTIRNDSDVLLTDLSPPGSRAPYLLINTAMNMQASGHLNLRDRRSEFFVFSKLFSGSKQTGYITTKAIQAAYAQITLATAMAISAAAAAPNMGRNTNGLLTMLMGLLNIRLGYWVPNPRLLQKDTLSFDDIVWMELRTQVFPRRHTVYVQGDLRLLLPEKQSDLLTANLVGLGFSGGGIRSASINLGIAQALHREGIFAHVDYLSTVSGGGYTGSAIATLMRHFPADMPLSSGAFAAIKKEAEQEIDKQTVTQANEKPVRRHRLPVLNFGRELVSCLHDKSDWVNVSDGGHIENLAAIELLRRRCKIVIVGDGEADPQHSFNGLATLVRLAKLELDTVIDINVDNIRLVTPEEKDQPKVCRSHFAVGRIIYPGDGDEKSRTGFLLYLKSSFMGNEEVLIREYRDRNEDFPHQTTADQFFDIGQFEAYRHLGQAIACEAIEKLSGSVESTESQAIARNVDLGSYDEFESSLCRYADRQNESS